MLGASRACSATHHVPRPRGDSAAFVEGVHAAVTTGGYQIVFGGNDDWMAALSAYRDEVPAQVAHPDFATVLTALDKVELAEHAHRVGLAAPHTVPATDRAMSRWVGPVVVKCRTHWHPGQTRRHRIDARQFPHITAALAQVNLIVQAGGDPVLQRPVDGDLGALVGIFHDGLLRGRVQQRTARLWPTPQGMSARAHTIPVDPTLVAAAERLLSDIGWHGLVELQFLTGADGVPHLIDLNGRFYGSLALADAACPGLLDGWARMVLGEPLPDLPDGIPGLRFTWWAGDLRRAAVERRGGLPADTLGTLASGLRARHSVWDRRDTGPTWQLIRERLRPTASQPESADLTPAPARTAT